MKVIIFASYFFPHMGGLEGYTRSLCKFLSERNIYCIIITCNTEKQDSVSNLGNTRVIRLDCWHILKDTMPVPKINKKNISLIREFFIEGPKFIITQTRFFPLSFLGALIARNIKTNHIHIEHGASHVFTGGFFRAKIFHLYDHIFGGFVVKKAKISVAISEKGDELLKHLGAQTRKTIHNSVDILEFPYVYKNNPENKNIIFIGRLIKDKGVHDLISAFRIPEFKNYKLIIVGDGNYRKELNKMAEGADNIVFTGCLKLNEIKKALSDAMILVNPSYLEGLPTTILEAGSSGVPIIAADAGGTNEIIDDNKSGFLVKAGNVLQIREKMLTLTGDDRLREKFSNELRKKIVRDFTWADNINKFIEILK